MAGVVYQIPFGLGTFSVCVTALNVEEFSQFFNELADTLAKFGFRSALDSVAAHWEQTYSLSALF